MPITLSLFSDSIDALGKLWGAVKGAAALPKAERERYRLSFDQTFATLDAALAAVITTLGALERVDDPGQLANELRGVAYSQTWLDLERRMRLCDQLRVLGRELEPLWAQFSAQLAVQNPAGFRQFMADMQVGEVALADYIARALDQLTHLGQTLNQDHGQLPHAKRTLRGIIHALQAEKRALMDAQIDVWSTVI
jgi:hypothetical protein